MKKNISTLLQKGNLTPKERSLLIVHDSVAVEHDSKGFLSDADKHALVEGWQPKDNNEVKQYNKYNDGWRTVGFAEIDAQTTYLKAQNAFLRAGIATTHYLHTDREKMLEKRNELSGKENPKRQSVLNTVLENSGLSREYTTYRYTFELMDKELKRDMLKLYPDVEVDSDYLNTELELYELLGEKGEVSQMAKEEIANLIAERAFNKYADAFKEKNGKSNVWNFSRYFAGIPLLEVAKKWAEYNGIDLPNKEGDEGILEKMLTEKITAHAEKRKTTVGELIKQTVRKWLNEGLLKAYAPLFLSDRKETVNGEDTTLPHKEIFRLWLKIKTEAEQKIEKMIDRGELKTRIIVDDILGFTREQETILGESLYGMKGDLKFVDDYKKQAEGFMPVAYLFELIKQNGLIDEYATLLGFQDILLRLSKVYEIDLSYKVYDYIATAKENMTLLNGILRMIKDRYGCEGYTFYDCFYFMDVPQTSFVFDLDRIEPKQERLDMYYQEFQKIFGNEF